MPIKILAQYIIIRVLTVIDNGDLSDSPYTIQFGVIDMRFKIYFKNFKCTFSIISMFSYPQTSQEYSTIENPHWSMAIRAEYRSKFEASHDISHFIWNFPIQREILFIGLFVPCIFLPYSPSHHFAPLKLFKQKKRGKLRWIIPCIQRYHRVKKP